MSMIIILINSIICFCFANFLMLTSNLPSVFGFTVTIVSGVAFVLIQVFPNFSNNKKYKKRLLTLSNGNSLLLVFLLSTVFSITYFLYLLSVISFSDDKKSVVFFIIYVVIVIFIQSVTFWNGIIHVYLSGNQLGIKHRVLGIVFGMVPIANLICLGIILVRSIKEVNFEYEKEKLNEERKDDKICKTKYPILMVHGVFFRDFRYFNYWGRIPDELIKNGADIYYGEHESALNVEDSAAMLAKRIFEIVRLTGAEKVNVIAHSKGGLDMRAALHIPGVKEHVASLTTVNTPHRGCEFADYLLNVIPEKQKLLVANAYNKMLYKLGDNNPDFIKAVTDLTHEACTVFNEKYPDVDGVYIRSIGSVMKKAKRGRFPLNFSYRLVKYFDGENDGLVGINSFPWGSEFDLIKSDKKRGISHGDMIDLNRENFDGFDVREYFVNTVSKLRELGY